MFKLILCLCLINAVAFAENQQVVDDNQTTSTEAPAEPVAVSASSSSSYTQVTGFYGGFDLGFSRLKNKMTRTDKQDKPTKSKSKGGFQGDAFVGYNFQIGRLFIGAECQLAMETAKPVAVMADNSQNSTEAKTMNLTVPGEGTSLKRKYTFGIVPRVGYAICGGFNAYVNLGTLFSKYSIKHSKKEDGTDLKKDSKNKNKPSFLVGLGVEQNFGPLFVRAECNKIFNRKIATVNSAKVGSNSYIVKLGAGYRF